VAAFEIMGTNLRVKDTILNGESEGKTFYEIINAGKAFGMITFDDYIIQLYEKGLITEETATAYASRKGIVGRGIDSVKAYAVRPPQISRTCMLIVIMEKRGNNGISCNQCKGRFKIQDEKIPKNKNFTIYAQSVKTKSTSKHPKHQSLRPVKPSSTKWVPELTMHRKTPLIFWEKEKKQLFCVSRILLFEVK